MTPSRCWRRSRPPSRRSAAPLLTALDAAAGDAGAGWSSTSRSRANAAALAAIAGQWLAGGSGRAPEAAITCRLDLAEAARQPDELIPLRRRHHRHTERHGWQLRRHPVSGQVTFERADRR